MRTVFTFLGSILIAGTAAAQSPQPSLPSAPNSMPKPNVATAPKETAPKEAAPKESAAPTASGAKSSINAPAQTGNSGRSADQSQQQAAPGQSSSRNEAPQSSSNQLNSTQKPQGMYPSQNLPLQQQGGPTTRPLQNQSSAQQSGSVQNPSSNRSTFSQGNQTDLNRGTSRDRDSHTTGTAPSSAAASNSAQNSNRNSTDRNSADRGNSGREHTALRANDLRAPDLGLWFDRSARDGLVISDIATSGAISRLGFREGDRIVSVNGRRIAREADFISYLLGNDLAAVTAQPVAVVVSRDGQDQTVEVDPSLLLADYGYVAPTNPLDQFGLVLDDRYNDQIMVWKVLPRSPAYYAGIRAGDVLTGFHDHPLNSARDFEQTVAAANPGDVGIQIRRDGRTRDLQVDVPRFDQGSEHRTAMRPNYDAGSADQSKHSDQSSQTNATQRSDQQQDNHSDRDSNRRGGFPANR